jgi:hypothetical protein
VVIALAAQKAGTKLAGTRAHDAVMKLAA